MNNKKVGSPKNTTVVGGCGFTVLRKGDVHYQNKKSSDNKGKDKSKK